MSLTISTRKNGDVTIVDVAGRIQLGEGAISLRNALRELLDKNETKILLNLGEVTYIDSSGIGEMVAGFTTVASRGGQLKLLNLTRRTKDLLQITKLYTVFDIHESEPSALRSFSAAAGA
jgi:anti-sigma B factor antagonist